MSRFFIFALLWYILGNPVVALLILLLILYAVDRRWIGLAPSVSKPFKRGRRIGRLRDELRLNPHHTSAKIELARLLMETKRYGEAAGLLEEALERLDGSDDVQADLAVCYLRLNREKEALSILEDIFARNPRVKYGEPLLILASYFARKNPEKALCALQKFQQIQSSSCEGWFRMGQIYETLGRKEESAAAYRSAQEIYRGLPKYKRKSERRWVVFSGWKTLWR